VLMLTKGSERRARLCSVAGDVVQQRVSVELAEGVDAGRLQAPGLHESTRHASVMLQQGSGRQKCHRRRSILVEAELTCNGGRGEIRRRKRAGCG
jgi:hypothetical protein